MVAWPWRDQVGDFKSIVKYRVGHWMQDCLLTQPPFTCMVDRSMQQIIRTDDGEYLQARRIHFRVLLSSSPSLCFASRCVDRTPWCGRLLVVAVN